MATDLRGFDGQHLDTRRYRQFEDLLGSEARLALSPKVTKPSNESIPRRIADLAADGNGRREGRFIILVDGKIGTASADTQLGDIPCIFPRALFTFMLRPVSGREDRYTFAGRCAIPYTTMLDVADEYRKGVIPLSKVHLE